MVIFDTNILIELYRGNSLIKKQVLEMDKNVFYISGITAAEFIAGARNKKELSIIEKQLSTYTYLPITTEISELFLALYRKYSLSHKPGIADTLIAATALYYELPVYTLNRKDFQYFPKIMLL